MFDARSGLRWRHSRQERRARGRHLERGRQGVHHERDREHRLDRVHEQARRHEAPHSAPTTPCRAQPRREDDPRRAGRDELVAAIDAGQTEVPHTPRVRTAASAHGPYLRDETIYVAHETGNEVTGINTETGEIEFTVGGISSRPRCLPIGTSDGCSCRAGRRKDEGDRCGVRADVGEVAVGDQAETMLLTRDHRTLIVSIRGTPARLAFVDARSLTLSNTIALAGTGTFGDLAAMSRDGRLVYATFDRGTAGVGGVAVVDIRRRAVIDTWDYPGVGRVHAWGIHRGRPALSASSEAARRYIDGADRPTTVEYRGSIREGAPRPPRRCSNRQASTRRNPKQATTSNSPTTAAPVERV